MQMPEPQDEHRWLHRLVGRWEGAGECAAGPGEPPITNRMRETFRKLGELWVVSDGEGEAPGAGSARSAFTFGYDPARKRFVGSFVVSVMTHFWTYEGSLDAAGQVLTMDCMGPSFGDPDVLVHYQDSFAFEGEDRRILTSRLRGTDGGWTRFMRAEFRRVG